VRDEHGDPTVQQFAGIGVFLRGYLRPTDPPEPDRAAAQAAAWTLPPNTEPPSNRPGNVYGG